MRNLAEVVTIEKVWPLEGKDRVQGASFVENSYEVMVSKDIQPGQLVAFIQEGAVLPVKENWEWLRKRCYKDNLNGKEGFLIKPQKFSGIKSWGLAVPLTDLGLKEEVYSKFTAGTDITDLLEIFKYEPEDDASPTKSDNKKAYPKWVKFCLAHFLTRWIGRIWQSKHQTTSGGFPTSLISKSDETTLQNMKGILDKFAETEVYVSGKMEGQSFTVVPVIKKGKFITAYPCARNTAYPNENDTVFWAMMKKYGIINKMKALWKKNKAAYIIQGEQVGPTIQDNIYDLNETEWFIFTIKDYNTGKQLKPADAMRIAYMDFGIQFVPILQSNVKLKDIMPDVETAIAYAEKASWKYEGTVLNLKYKPTEKDVMWKDYFQHEGVVVRSMDYDKDSNVGFSFKIKNADYAEYGRKKIHKACLDFKANHL